MSCAICLDDLTSPVCPPCGHIHCERCLAAYISSRVKANINPSAIPCPTCKSAFSIVSLDEKWIPKKFHQFMHPTIRKVYLPDESDAKERIKTLESELSEAKSIHMDTAILYDQKLRQYEDLSQRQAQLLDTINNQKRTIEAMTVASQQASMSIRSVQTMTVQVMENLHTERQNHLDTLQREKNQNERIADLQSTVDTLNQQVQGMGAMAQPSFSQNSTFQYDPESSFEVDPHAVHSAVPEVSNAFTGFQQTTPDESFLSFYSSIGQ